MPQRIRIRMYTRTWQGMLRSWKPSGYVLIAVQLAKLCQTANDQHLAHDHRFNCCSLGIQCHAWCTPAAAQCMV